MFLHYIQTKTWTYPDGKMHNVIYHVLIVTRRHSNVADVRCFKGADRDI